nr:protein transport protein sec9 [Quercus suber]
MRFGRKKEDPNAPGEAENESKSGKGGLFGFRSQDKSPAQSTNPYAAPSPSQNPYAARSVNGNPYAAGPARRDPYSASDASLTQPPTSSFGSLSLKSEGNAPPPYTHSTQTDARRNEKSPASQAAAPRFQTQITPSYGAGYGGDNYGSSQPARMNGYGGMTRTRSQDTLSTDAARNALFEAAPQRLRQQASNPPKTVELPQHSQEQGTSYSNIANYGSDAMPGGYGHEGSSPDAQLRWEDDEVAKINQKSHDVREESIASLVRALNLANHADETGSQAHAQLVDQGTSLHNAMANLDASHNHNIIAQSQLRELKVADRSMFVPHIPNPFNKAARERAEDDVVIKQRRSERERRGEIQYSRYDSQTRQQQVNHELGREVTPSPFKRSNVKDHKYVVDDDKSGEEQEEKINDLNDALLKAVVKLRVRGEAIGIELDHQAKTANELHDASNLVADEIAGNSAGLSRFERRR